jgi:hypothetical protein
VTVGTDEHENRADPGSRVARSDLGMEMCPPLLVDSVVDQIRPPYPRLRTWCAPGRHGGCPGVHLDDRGAAGPPSATQTASAPDGVGSAPQ